MPRAAAAAAVARGAALSERSGASRAYSRPSRCHPFQAEIGDTLHLMPFGPTWSPSTSPSSSIDLQALTLIYDRSKTASIVVSSLLLTGYAEAKLLREIWPRFQNVNHLSTRPISIRRCSRCGCACRSCPAAQPMRKPFRTLYTETPNRLPGDYHVCQSPHIVVHYHELWLKGGNRRFFLGKLIHCYSSRALDGVGVERAALPRRPHRDRIAPRRRSRARRRTIVARVWNCVLRRGARNYPRTSRCRLKFPSAGSHGKNWRRSIFPSFAVRSKRSDKSFALKSAEIESLSWPLFTRSAARGRPRRPRKP